MKTRWCYFCNYSTSDQKYFAKHMDTHKGWKKTPLEEAMDIIEDFSPEDKHKGSSNG